MIICGLDLETTGLDPNKDQITEIGAVLWDTDINAPVAFFNKLIKIEGSVPAEIVKLTGITDELLVAYGEPLEQVLTEFQKFQEGSLMFLAHNAPFDHAFLTKHLKVVKQWIDSSVDVDFPDNIQTRKLTHLAAEHGFVNPFAHRAMTDVLTMMQIVSCYEWSEVIKNAQTPNVILRAMVSYEQNQKAKGTGFRWDATKKFWIKQVKEHRAEQEIKKCSDLGFLAKRIG